MSNSSAPPLEVPGAPLAVLAALQRLRADLIMAAGANLAGLILYGGLARGRYRPGQSDVNVVVLLHEMKPPQLMAIAPALQAAWRAAAVTPLLLTPTEVKAGADAFATKFLDIQHHHRVLHGENPFVGLEVQRRHLRLRVEQELRNLLLRLRRQFVSLRDEPTTLARVLAGAARPFALKLEALLGLTAHPVPSEDRSATVFEAAAQVFGLDREALARLAALRQDRRAEQNVLELYERVLMALSRAAEIADQMSD